MKVRVMSHEGLKVQVMSHEGLSDESWRLSQSHKSFTKKYLARIQTMNSDDQYFIIIFWRSDFAQIMILQWFFLSK